MKLVMLDGYTKNHGDLGWERFEAFGEFINYDRTPIDHDMIVRRIGNADAVFTNKVPITNAVLDACPNLKYVGVVATGFDVVDLAAARSHNVVVTNVPVYGTAAVGQTAIGLLLEICHHIGHHSDAVHSGRWADNPDFCFWDYPLIELAGKTMGIIGFGRIGQVTGRIAKAMDMKIIAYDEYPNDTGKAIAEYAPLDLLFRNADVVVLHCPLLPSTRGIINKTNIEKMKDGVIILNNARGPLVVEQDLADALNTGKVYAAGIDVASREPINADNPLLTAKNCIITPHISGACTESRRRLLEITADNFAAFLAGRPVNRVDVQP
jgi:glycerate dehydrogenase